MSDYEPVVPKVINGVEFKKKLDELLASKRIDSDAWNVVVTKLGSCKLDIQPPARIEAAIRLLRAGTRVKDGYFSLTYKESIDLLLFATSQPQKTWKPGDFGLEEEK